MSGGGREKEREGRKSGGQKGRAEIQRDEAWDENSKRERKKRDEREEREEKDWEERDKEKRRKEERVWMHACMCGCAAGGQHATSPPLFKPPRASSKSDIVVGFNLSFQHCKQTFS